MRVPVLPPCVPHCDTPSLPPVLVGTLMHRHRMLAGLSHKSAAAITAIPASRIGTLEKARSPLSTASARTLLEAYGAPARETQDALVLLGRPGHQHRLDGFTLSPVWLDALRASARSALVYSAEVLPSALLLPADPPQSAAPSRRPAPRDGCRLVLLLDESVLDRVPGGRPDAGLSRLVHLAENRSISVQLVPRHVTATAPARLLAEFTCTAWDWGGSSTQRLARQVYLTPHPREADGSVLNAGAAATERQWLEQAARRALPSQWSLHQLRQAARGHQQPAACAGARRATALLLPDPAPAPEHRPRRMA